MPCELCGNKEAPLRANVEGTTMQVCRSCARFGKQVHKVQVRQMQPTKKTPAKPDVLEVMVQDYAKRIREARESRKLKQEDFAKTLNIKTSLLQNMETGKFKPSTPLAKSIEKVLGIKLLEEVEETVFAGKPSKREGFTLGDFIKK